MITKVHCPGCQAPLRVPESASGRVARCPSCGTRFTVPAKHEIIDETVLTWIERDPDEEDAQDAAAAAVRAAAAKAGTPAAREPRQPTPTGPIAPAKATQATQATAPPAHTVEPRSFPKPVIASTAAAPAHVASAAPAAPPAAASPPAAAPSPLTPRVAVPLGTPSTDASAYSHAYPTDLIPTGPQPHLIVRDVTQSGVRFAFDANWLEHPGFQSSMPVRCAFSGAGEVAQLLLRPMAFIDRSGGLIRAPRAVESRFEQHMLPGHSPREMLPLIGTIDGLSKPFNSPVLYFVHQNFTSQSLVCTTKTRPDGGVTCEVVIPDIRVALDWLIRVNGATGNEYGLLEREISLMEGDRWSILSNLCRQRLAVWCKFLPHERFLAYLSDSEFSLHDQGLAGIVVTDRRLIYHKHHHNGQADLDKESRLILRPQGQLTALSLDSEGTRIKVGKVHSADVPTLVDALSGAKGMRVVSGDEG